MKTFYLFLGILLWHLTYSESNAQSLNFDNSFGSTIVIDNTRTIPIGGTLSILTSSSSITVDVPLIISGADPSKSICVILYLQDSKNTSLTQILYNGRFTGYRNGNNQGVNFSIDPGSDYISSPSKINGGKLFACLINNDNCYSVTTTTGCQSNLLLSSNVTFTGPAIIIPPSTTTTSGGTTSNTISSNINSQTNVDFGIGNAITDYITIGKGYSFCQQKGNKPPLMYLKPSGYTDCFSITPILTGIQWRIFSKYVIEASEDKINWQAVLQNVQDGFAPIGDGDPVGTDSYSKIKFSYNKILNVTTYFRVKKYTWNCQGIKYVDNVIANTGSVRKVSYDGYTSSNITQEFTIRVYDNSVNDLITITPTSANLNCVNFGNQYNVPSYTGSTYQWDLSKSNLPSNIYSTFNNYLSGLSGPLPAYLIYPILGSYKTNILNTSPAPIGANGIVTISVTGVCPGQTLTNSYTQQFTKPSVTSFLPTSIIAIPSCNSSSPIYVTHFPYVDGTSSFTLTVPSGKGWQIKNYPGTVVTIPENTNLELEQNSVNALLSQAIFQIPVQVNYSCGTPTTSLLGAITVGGYNPISTNIKLSSSSNEICSTWGGSIYFSINLPNAFTYYWYLNGRKVTPDGGYVLWYPPYYIQQGGSDNITLPQANNGNAQFVMGKNEIKVEVYGPTQCARRSLYTFTTTVNVAGFGEFRENPITIDPTTGQAKAYLDGGTYNTIGWGIPSTNALTRISPIVDPLAGGSANFTSAYTEATYGANFTNGQCGTNSPTYINVSMSNSACGYTSKQLIINPTVYSAVVSPSFSTACASAPVPPLTVTRSGGRTPYGAGTWGSYDPSKSSWLTNKTDNSVSINSGGTAGSVTVFYNSVDATGCPISNWAGATVNLTAGSGGASSGWGSGQLVNTACAQNLGVLSNSFSNFWIGNQVVNFIGTDNKLHYYYFDQNSPSCNGNSAWILDNKVPEIPGNLNLSASGIVPRSGTPFWSGIENGYLAFYISGFRIVRINGNGTTNQSTSLLTNQGNYSNFSVVGKKLYFIDNQILKVINDITSAAISFSTVSPSASNISGNYLQVIGNNAYYAKGNPSVLTRLDLTSGLESIPNSSYLIDNNSELAKATNEGIFIGGTSYGTSNNGMIAFTSGNGTQLNYFNTATGNLTPIFPLPFTANGKIAPVNGSSISSIFFTGTNGNVYQAGVFSNNTWSVKKATDTNIGDQAGGYMSYNSSNVLYLTNSAGSGLVYNLYPTGCGSTIRKEDPTSESDSDSKNHGFRFYPNPFTGNVQIDLNTTEEELVIVDIYDITGTKITRLNEAIPQKGQRSLIWETGAATPKGVYLARVLVNGKSVYSQKLVAE